MNAYFKNFVDVVGGFREAATVLGISQHTVTAIFYGFRKVSPALALKIETLTKGEFKKERFIWPHPEDVRVPRKTTADTYSRQELTP